MYRLAASLLLVACEGKDGVLTAITEPATTSDSPSTTSDSPSTGDPSGDPAGLCDPSNLSNPRCPADHTCCSDDPATVGGKLPNYFTGTIDGAHDIPIFSGDNNGRSSSGQCFDLGVVTVSLANGCPVPCNPTWDAARLTEICGDGELAACCPSRAVDPDKDCVSDLQTGLWRAVDGHDIPGLTFWGDTHATNQDPYGTSCGLFADPNVDQAAYDDCIDQLTVADQRGFCHAAGACPCQEDLCAMKNAGWVPTCP